MEELRDAVLAASAQRLAIWKDCTATVVRRMRRVAVDRLWGSEDAWVQSTVSGWLAELDRADHTERIFAALEQAKDKGLDRTLRARALCAQARALDALLPADER